MLTNNGVKAQIILENGTTFYGEVFGYVKETVGEVIFNTSMTGYQEMLTDPTYAGQIVVCTYPMIGNCGINLDDMESDYPKLKGLVVRESCKMPNNWRCEMELADFFKQNKIMGIEGIDTRALTKELRESGMMKGIITTRLDELSQKEIEQKFLSFTNANVVQEVTTQKNYKIEGTGRRLAVLDLGIKRSVLNELTKRDFNITVFSAFSSYQEIMHENPDALFVSNGPGNPEDLAKVVETIKQFTGKIPVSGVGMGYQLIALALGCKTEKMKFGHHGANYPVRNEETKRVYITSQNHGYTVKDVPKDVVTWFTNVNDGTVEGIKHKTLPVMGTEFQTEAVPGTKNAESLLGIFTNSMEGGIKNA